MTQLITCSAPDDTFAVDPYLAHEHDSAQAAGLEARLIDLDALYGEQDGDIECLHPDQASHNFAIYRGYRLLPSTYARLYNRLLSEGTKLINTPRQYRNAQSLMYAHDRLADHMPTTVTMKTDADLAHFKRHLKHLPSLMEAFEGKPVVVRDVLQNVITRNFTEAAFIPVSDDITRVRRQTQELLRYLGDAPAEGLAYQAYVHHPSVELGEPAPVGHIFFLDGQPLIRSIIRPWTDHPPMWWMTGHSASIHGSGQSFILRTPAGSI